MKPNVQQLTALCMLCMCGCTLLNLNTPELLDPKEPLTVEQLQEFETQVLTRNLVRIETSVMSATASDKRIRDEL